MDLFQFSSWATVQNNRVWLAQITSNNALYLYYEMENKFYFNRNTISQRFSFTEIHKKAFFSKFEIFA